MWGMVDIPEDARLHWFGALCVVTDRKARFWAVGIAIDGKGQQRPLYERARGGR